MRFAVLLAIGLHACTKPAPSAAPKECARVGDTCEVAPGKLGTCVRRDECVVEAPSCFVCQSQH